jgi:hypothetical protein
MTPFGADWTWALARLSKENLSEPKGDVTTVRGSVSATISQSPAFNVQLPISELVFGLYSPVVILYCMTVFESDRQWTSWQPTQPKHAR